MDKVSALIPTYNVVTWIEESIHSILNQTYENIEVIIVDDHSTDGTFELLEKLASNDERIRLFRNKENSKIVMTLNYGLTKVTGKYVVRHDGDDIAALDKIEKQIEYLKRNNLDLVGCQMIPIDESGNQIGKISKLPVGFEKISKTAEFSSPITHIWLTKKFVYDSLNGYREVPYAEDYDFILRCLDAKFKCDNMPIALMKIRHRSGNTADLASLSQRKGHLYALKLHKQRLKKGNDNYQSSEVNKLLKSNFLLLLAHNKSTYFLRKAYYSKSKLSKLLYSILSCILSYYNVKYLYSRLKTKNILSK